MSYVIMAKRKNKYSYATTNGWGAKYFAIKFDNEEEAWKVADKWSAELIGGEYPWIEVKEIIQEKPVCQPNM